MEVNTTYEPYADEPEYIDANRDLLKTVPQESVKRVLDLACGTGLMTRLLIGLNPGVVSNGVDMSAESLNIGRKQFGEKGMLATDDAELIAASQAGKSAMMMEEGSADTLRFADGTFDMAMMGNAIHLMPDKDKFLDGVNRVLKPGAPFCFNSVFFTGTFGEGTEPVYTEWMMQAMVLLNKKNEARVAAGEPPIKRVRGKAGKAFDKDWKTGEEWGELLERHGFKVVRTYKRPIHMTQRGLELVGAYGGLAEVLMSGYPVDIASECLQEAVGIAFRNKGVTEIVRYWLEVTAVKQ